SIDRKNEKVSLSLKKILPNPWQNIAEKYGVGQIVKGKIVRLAPFGAFVELELGIDALIHISQLSDKRIGTPSEVVKVGEEVTAKVTDVDIEKHKISLSIRELNKEKEKTESETELAAHQTQEQPPAPTLGESLGEDLQRELAEVSGQTGLIEVSSQTELTKVNEATELVVTEPKEETVENDA
ncbi:MAG: S1 RNA-binding domain-containing protein, partial [Eubacteriales bacterium]